MGEPEAEIDIDVSLVRSLLRDQHPDLAHQRLQEVGSGWDNAIFRLGSELVVRLPRRQLSVPLVLHEQEWLPELAPNLTLPVPVPLRRGVPGPRYPWPWSVTRWFPGTAADRVSRNRLALLVEQLARFLVSLHRPAPAAAPRNPYRGIPLAERDQRTREQLTALGNPQAMETWDMLCATPAWPGPPMWLHGDLHPSNLIVGKSGLAAVIDFGDICAGDPATDLAVAWLLFDLDLRARFRAVLPADSDTWARARAWALALGAAWTKGGKRLAAIGQRAMLAAISDDS